VATAPPAIRGILTIRFTMLLTSDDRMPLLGDTVTGRAT
jgi:hypothetical protein